MIGVDRAITTLTEHGDPTGESRRHRLSEVMVRNNASGVYTATGATAFIRNPSARMRLIFALGFRRDAGEPSNSDVTGWTATAQAFVKFGPDSGFYLPGNGIIPGPAALSTALPWSYETETMVDRIRIDVAVPNAPGSGAPAGNLWLMAAWEPTSGAIIGDGELADMQKQCAIEVVTGLVVSQTGV